MFTGYVLAHQDDFDVRWCKGTIAEEIFTPWVNKMRELGGPDVLLGGRRVQTVELGEPGARARVVASAPNGEFYFNLSVVECGQFD